MLAANGWRGTYYASLGLMGGSGGAGQMFALPDLEALLAAGHELACHTFSHTSCLSVNTAKFLDECAENRRRAATMLDGYRLQNFSFPHGHATLAAKRSLNSIYDTCRSNRGGINSDPLDLGFLRANPIYSSLPIENLKQLIQANARANGWLVLYTHDIAEEPSPYGCTPEYFEAVLLYVHESQTEVVPICEGARRFTASESVR